MALESEQRLKSSKVMTQQVKTKGCNCIFPKRFWLVKTLDEFIFRFSFLQGKVFLYLSFMLSYVNHLLAVIWFLPNRQERGLYSSNSRPKELMSKFSKMLNFSFNWLVPLTEPGWLQRRAQSCFSSSMVLTFSGTQTESSSKSVTHLKMFPNIALRSTATVLGHLPLCINSNLDLLLNVTSCHSRTPVHATILLATPCGCPMGFALPWAADTPACQENKRVEGVTCSIFVQIHTKTGL